MINFGQDSKQSEESEKSVKEFKRKNSVSIINDPCLKAENFRRVELTSSFKRLPKIPHKSGPYQQCEIELVESHSQSNSGQKSISIFKRNKTQKSSSGSSGNSGEKKNVAKNTVNNLNRSDMMTTPKERDIAPKAFKRSKKEIAESNASNSQNKRGDLLKYK